MPSSLLQIKPHYEGMRVVREEYLDSADDGPKYDMIGGVLHMAPSPDAEHGEKHIHFAADVRYYPKRESLHH